MKSPAKLTTFPNETRLLTVGRETLVEVDATLPAEKGRRFFVANTRDGFRTDYPYCHFAPEKRVFWDNPEWFSKRFRLRATSKICRLLSKRANGKT
jgi:hypothetical protein